MHRQRTAALKGNTLMKIRSQLNFDDAAERTHVFGVFSGDKGPLCSHKEFADLLKKFADEDVFKGNKGQICFIRASDDVSPNFLFAGLGKAEEVNAEQLRIAGANIARRLDSEKIKDAALSLSSFHGKGMKKLPLEKIGYVLAQGALFSMYSFNHYKSEKAKAALSEIVFYTDDKKTQNALDEALHVAQAENDALTIARDFSNEPGSVLHPMELAKRVQKLAKDYKLSCKILDMKTLEKEGMEGIVGVGKGSTNKPCLIALEYKPAKAKKTVAFVGKAVTFDSGGVSLKPGAGMEDMKHDMSGGADVIAAICLAAKLKVPHRIVCIVPSAENMPDGGAMIPSTILKMRSGKTVEVQNTDAEGRLILADALDFAQDYKPDVIIDVATLTGAAVMALGNVAASIMSNDEATLDKFKAAAKETAERYVELPIFPEYVEDIKSKIADIKNIGSSGSGAGSQKGGAFLQEFIKNKTPWVHVDIAGTAWSAAGLAYHPKYGGTGHTVRTLVQFAMDY